MVKHNSVIVLSFSYMSLIKDDFSPRISFIHYIHSLINVSIGKT